MAKNRYNIAVIPGDGIGKEVVPEALKVLEKIAGNTISIFILIILILVHTIIFQSMDK